VVTKYSVWGCAIAPCWFAGREENQEKVLPLHLFCYMWIVGDVDLPYQNTCYISLYKALVPFFPIHYNKELLCIYIGDTRVHL
jgi:hypothetical protein